jgi:glycosyltransferase involved in cell wall biosynthesis
MNRAEIQPLSENPLVSVLMTSYNYEKYVGEAIASVFAQTYRNIELIVVDDGSTDRSVEIIRAAIQNAPIPTKFIEQINAGQASALNTAYQHAHGEVVCFIDSDDLWLPNKVETTLEFMRWFPGGGMYQHQLDNTRGNLKKQLLISGDIFQEWMKAGTVDVLKQKELVGVFLPTTGLAMYKQVLDRVFPIPERLITCPDAYLSRASCCHGPLYSDLTILGSWRDHGENAGKGRFNFREYWLPVVMPSINEYFEREGLPIRFVSSTRSTTKASKAKPSKIRRFFARLGLVQPKD